MFKSFPGFMYIHGTNQRFTRNGTRSPWWLVMAPGLVLICIAVTMLIWPELLAYMVATVLLCIGTVLAVLGWRMRQIERHVRQGMRPFHDRDLYTPDD